MKKIFFSIVLGVSLTHAYSQSQPELASTGGKVQLKTPALLKTDTSAKKETVKKKAEPFAFGDFTWLNGNDRRHTALLDSKYFTGRVLLDVNYTASNNNPIDHTVVGSTALARDHEFEISTAALGGDFHYQNVRAT